MKKIFILTGEPSGDKLASKVISKLQKTQPNIEYSCVGGTHLNLLGIEPAKNQRSWPRSHHCWCFASANNGSRGLCYFDLDGI